MLFYRCFYYYKLYLTVTYDTVYHSKTYISFYTFAADECEYNIFNHNKVHICIYSEINKVSKNVIRFQVERIRNFKVFV